MACLPIPRLARVDHERPPAHPAKRQRRRESSRASTDDDHVQLLPRSYAEPCRRPLTRARSSLLPSWNDLAVAERLAVGAARAGAARCSDDECLAGDGVLQRVSSRRSIGAVGEHVHVPRLAERVAQAIGDLEAPLHCLAVTTSHSPMRRA
jgi:hypothetical protein